MEEKRALAIKFCPILRFNKRGPYTPTNFIELLRTEKGNMDFTGSQPNEKWERKAKFNKETGLRWFAPTYYVHVLEDVIIEIDYKRKRVPLIIQYYYYFPYNVYFWGELQVPFLNHHHDWEVIQVALVEFGAKNNHEIYSYSISAHGTFVVIRDKQRVKFYKENGFYFNRGAHNLGSIFYQPNRHNKDDILIRPDTLVPKIDGNKIPFKDTLINIDKEYEIEFLKKFTFYPILAPWKRHFYDSATWRPEFWSWSFNRALKHIFGLVEKSEEKPPKRKKR